MRLDWPLPPAPWLPGEGPHPLRGGHGHRGPEDPHQAWLHGLDLFDHGFHWEAHEVWEGPWRLSRDRGLQGMITLAAACVKIRQGRPSSTTISRAEAQLTAQPPPLDWPELVRRVRAFADGGPAPRIPG